MGAHRMCVLTIEKNRCNTVTLKRKENRLIEIKRSLNSEVFIRFFTGAVEMQMRRKKKVKNAFSGAREGCRQVQDPSKADKEAGAFITFDTADGLEGSGRTMDLLTAGWGNVGARAKSRKFNWAWKKKAEVSVETTQSCSKA